MRSARVSAVVLAALCAAVPAARANTPVATVSGSGTAVQAQLSSGSEYCADHATFADAGWPPVGLDRLVPATAGQTVRIAFTQPATIRSADVTGLAAPIVRSDVASMTPDGPAAWRLTLPSAPDPAGKALEFTVEWADGGGCHGQQMYAVGLGAPAEIGRVEARAGAVRATVLAHAAVTVVATLRSGGTTLGRVSTALAAGARRALSVPVHGHARRARLRLVITTADGGRTVVTRRVRLRA